jgi:rod shape-determining protein MreD
MIKILLALILLFISTAIQVSFLSHFGVFGLTPNLVFVLILIWNLCEDRAKMFGIFYAILAGLLLDLFSEGIVGYQMSILLVMTILIKKILKKHVRVPFTKDI